MIDEIGILCGDKPWGICEQKSISMLYLSIGTEGGRIFKSKHPHFLIEKQPFKELWQAMEDSFTKVRNITYDRFVFYSCKQQKIESVESSYDRLIEQAKNCCLGSEETTFIRDAFTLNMIDHETQKELLKETVEPCNALEIAIQMEMGAQNQQKINQNLMPATNSVNVVNNYLPRNRNANAQKTRKLEGISHDIQLYTKTTNIVVSVPIAANGGVVITDEFAPQMGKSVIIAE